MTRAEIDTALREEFHRIAPDIDVDAIDRSADLREEIDIDSMDFLNLVTALGKRLGIDIPEVDYDKMQTYDAMVDHLARSVA